MNIKTELVKQLRDETGVSVMQCQKALIEAEGDIEKARVILRKKGAESVAKKSDRTLGAGAIAAYVHSTGTVGTLVELACETDFVGKNPDFKALAYDIAMHIAATNPRYLKSDEVKEEDKKTAIDVFAKEVEGKPEAMKEKILQGKLDAYFKEQVLLEQAFIKNPDLTIKNLIEQATQKFGEKVELQRYTRFATLDK
jgi:elongation factor Ts